MGLFQRLGAWLDSAAVSTPAYECERCDALLAPHQTVVDSEEESCPTCGGAVREVTPIPTVEYLGPMI